MKTTAQQTRNTALATARSIYAYTQGTWSWSACMKAGWAKAKADAKIAAGGDLTVTYTTNGGTVTTRTATALSGNYTPTGAQRASCPLTVVYFDKTAGGVRCFRADRLVAIQ